MVEKKRQHYVPKFYLQNFSWGEGRNPIKLFNIKRGSSFTEGSLKNQCYEDYLYGTDLIIENAFGPIEGRAAEIIKKIVSSGEPPIRYSADHDALLTFILLQYARTKHAGEAAEEQVEKLMKAVLSKDERFDSEYVDNVKIGLKNPFALTLKTMVFGLPLAHDLQIKIAFNRTSIRFVTSDHPVVFYNQYAENRLIRGSRGLANKGLQIFYPISPYHMVILYDESIYKIGERKSTSTEIYSSDDVRQLNDLQWLNALENIYFDNTQPLSEIERGSKKNISRRSTEKTLLQESEQITDTDGLSSSTLMIRKNEFRTGLRLDFLKCLKTMTDRERLFGGVQVRDPQLVEIHREFLAAVDSGRYKASEFGKFVQEQVVPFVDAVET